MAIDLGKMFGFDYKENFIYPYTSQSITEFWRRWHISLGSFLAGLPRILKRCNFFTCGSSPRR